MNHISRKSWIFSTQRRTVEDSGENPVDRAGTPGGERRAAARYPLRLGLSYRLMHRNLTLDHGPAQIENISSSGVLMIAERTFRIGATLELNIEWPVMRDGRLTLELQMTGRVVRSRDQGTAVRALSHDACIFRPTKSVEPAKTIEPCTP